MLMFFNKRNQNIELPKFYGKHQEDKHFYFNSNLMQNVISKTYYFWCHVTITLFFSELKIQNPKSIQKEFLKATSAKYISQQVFIWSVDSNSSIQDAYSEPCQISKLQLFAKKVNGFQPLTIFAKRFILNAWQGSAYASAYIQLLINFHIQLIKGNKLTR